MPIGKHPLMLMMTLSMPGAAHALGLGDIHVDSGLNERFAAEIDIVGATALDLIDLRPLSRIARPSCVTAPIDRRSCPRRRSRSLETARAGRCSSSAPTIHLPSPW